MMLGIIKCQGIDLDLGLNVQMISQKSFVFKNSEAYFFQLFNMLTELINLGELLSAIYKLSFANANVFFCINYKKNVRILI